ncbi:MAG: thermonuclease family protein [Patescibacteria group bacterium]|nr:thermonuclease family protein [Patescibacteria group bacterium]
MVVIGLVVVAVAVLYTNPNPMLSQQLAANQPGLYPVSRFVDGDTIAVMMAGKEEKVRFIGVDTPETHKPNTPVQCYGPAAAAYTKTMIGTQRVRLESDSLSTDRDRYDRLLRYVYLPDGTLLNQEIIENGYGFYYPYFTFSKADTFSAAQHLAQASNKGLWGNCSPVKKGDGYTSNVAA